MLFNSIIFFVFLLVVYLVWRLLPFKHAKRFLCLASLFFYGYWFPPYLLILLGSGSIDFFTAFQIEKRSSGRKFWLLISLISNLTILCGFKYLNFFNQTFADLGNLVGIRYEASKFDFLLPIGISFYTFESISYIIDVYRRKISASKSLTDYFLYIAFFPHLVAGPIIRASDLIPQLQSRRPLDIEAWRFFLYRVLRGLFLKVCIADNIGRFSQYVFSLPYNQLTVAASWIGAIAFAIQIFCDFAGYSDIAIGVARLFQLHINQNFNNPYSATSLEDFWRRWHISLSKWFRDYLYIPLGGNQRSKLRTELNVFIVFVVSGFWHGANWTFIAWGVIHGLALGVEKLFKNLHGIKMIEKYRWSLFLSWSITMLVVLFAWVPFRAPSLHYAIDYWRVMVGNAAPLYPVPIWTSTMLMLSLFVTYQIFQTLKEKTFVKENWRIQRAELLIYFAFILTMPGPPLDFIYFQF